MSHIATAVVEVVALKRTFLRIVIERRERGERQFLYGLHLV